MPERIQLQRRKGWRMPPNSVKVDRSTKWGNPWTDEKAREIGFCGTDEELREMCVRLFRNGLARRLPALRFTAEEAVAELRGKNLACWCKPGAPCHADVLIEIANGPICEAVDGPALEAPASYHRQSDAPG
jgi:hypothetical protein